jgi:hypothetical protein
MPEILFRYRDLISQLIAATAEGIRKARRRSACILAEIAARRRRNEAAGSNPAWRCLALQFPNWPKFERFEYQFPVFNAPKETDRKPRALRARRMRNPDMFLLSRDNVA